MQIVISGKHLIADQTAVRLETLLTKLQPHLEQVIESPVLFVMIQDTQSVHLAGWIIRTAPNALYLNAQYKEVFKAEKNYFTAVVLHELGHLVELNATGITTEQGADHEAMKLVQLLDGRMIKATKHVFSSDAWQKLRGN